MFSKTSFNLLVVSNTTPFFAVVQIIYFHDCRSGLREHVKRAAYYAGWLNYQCVENVALPLPSDW